MVAPVPVIVPVPEIPRKLLLFAGLGVELNRLKVNVSPPLITVQSAGTGVEGMKTQGWVKAGTAVRGLTTLNEPETTPTEVVPHVLTPVAASREVVVTPPESCSVKPLPGADWKVMPPVISAAFAALESAKATSNGALNFRNERIFIWLVCGWD